MRWCGFVLVASACGSPSKPPEPTTSVPIGPHTPGSADDDFPHRRVAMQLRLNGANTCVPAGQVVDYLNEPSDAVVLALDVIGNDLVACGQVMTRREESVFFDQVSYACWTLDPRTGALARRADLGRSYYACHDGSCAPLATESISYDGAYLLRGSGSQLSIVTRPTGQPVATFGVPVEAGHEWSAGDSDVVSDTVFVQTDDKTLLFDLHGVAKGELPRGFLHVLGDGRVSATETPTRAVIYDTRSSTRTALAIPGCSATDLEASPEDRPPACAASIAAWHLEDAIAYRGVLYGIDNVNRRLLVLGRDFREDSSVQLRVCS